MVDGGAIEWRQDDEGDGEKVNFLAAEDPRFLVPGFWQETVALQKPGIWSQFFPRQNWRYLCHSDPREESRSMPQIGMSRFRYATLDMTGDSSVAMCRQLAQDWVNGL